MSAAATSPRLIGQLLLARALISAADLENALQFQTLHGGRLGGILVRLGALSEDNLLTALAEQTGYGIVAARDVLVSDMHTALEALGWAPQQPQALGVLLWHGEDGQLNAAAHDPLDASLQEQLEAAAAAASPGSGADIHWHFIRAHELEQAHAALAASTQADNAHSAEHWRELAEDAPIIAFVNSLFAQAMDERASDVHIEPGERLCEIRFRIDGVLHPRGDVPLQRYPAIASRVKLIAGLDIAERRLPQDGRITLRASGTEIDLRVSVIPAVHGEAIVLRLLPKAQKDLHLERLGFSPRHLAMLRSWTDLPNGLVLVTGPTGSGKSTTLYAALAAINGRDRKVITVEDPVEQRLPGIVQIQVQADIGYTFGRALRAILRHDPDIILIGEIRDRETAEIAIQSALTGHLVLATLHTNDALSAFTRLVDMGVEPYLVAASVQAVMAQRLVRRLCPDCGQAAAAPVGWESLSGADGSPPLWRSPTGCVQCQHTGYRGRLGIHELVQVDATLRQALVQQAPLAQLQAIANAAGRSSLLQDGMDKAAHGHTSAAEVLRIAGEVE